MEEEKENSQTEETSQEETEEEIEEETDELNDDVDKIKSLNKQLYARTKKAEEAVKAAEERAKKFEDSLKSFKSTEINASSENSKRKDSFDIEELVEVTSVLEGLDASEKKRLIQESRLKNASLKEAKEDEDFVLWQKSHREKVAQEQSEIDPSSRQPDKEKEKSFEEQLESATLEEKEKLLSEKGLWKPPKRRPESERIKLSG